MGFGIFMHRADSIYDDSPAEQYQFPSQYLSRVLAVVGDWVVYLEPSKIAKSRGYFAVAKVQQVMPDVKAPGMYLAVIEPGSYLDFANPVPFSESGQWIEQGVLNEAGKVSGRAQSAVRPLSPADFNRIVERGLVEAQPFLQRTGDAMLAEVTADEILVVERERVTFTASRIVRDRIFRRVVLQAYGERCAISGLKLINGGGRAEVEAAHIRPVEADGPDVVSNGLALCGTAHWMFDRGLIGLADDLTILVSRHVNDIEGVCAFINRERRASLPIRFADRPHPHFVQWHRENRFKA
ncbi:MAG: HNH endonuclease [Janthinobacterium lividum]